MDIRMLIAGEALAAEGGAIFERRDLAAQTAGSAHGPWRISNSPALNMARPNDLLRKTLGLASLAAGQAA